MEVSGVVLRPIPYFCGAGFSPDSGTQFKENSVLGTAGKKISGKVLITSGGSREIRVRVSAKPIYSCVGCEFSDEGHRQYYESVRSGGKKKEKKDKILGADMVKKRLKLIKGLTKDLSVFYEMGFGGQNGEDLVEEVRGKMISEAAEVLLTQLQQLKAEEKEIKRKKKEEKAALKAARMKAMADDTSSSSSSESSNSDCEEIVDMNLLRSKAIAEPTTEQPQASSEVVLPLTIPSLPSIKQQQTIELIENCTFSAAGQECNLTTTSIDRVNCNGNSGAVALSERIEVCMGGKCKKSGALELLEEFQRRVGVEGAVVGCKCMGKCRDGPNVRVSSCCDKEEAFVRPTANPLCIGVGLEDVGVIVSNFFGENKTDMGLLAA
ncbi:diacylglycerol acyltransferase [Tasmannia lanceolata]|uniref:diacylglycerol acyltransferase n=1 Tax=Tasmannia lanceolata TaxID=3420 RepID=UPI004062FA74